MGELRKIKLSESGLNKLHEAREAKPTALPGWFKKDIDNKETIMNNSQYSPLVSKFLTYGKVEASAPWSDYKKLGFSHEHIPELMTMVADDALHDADQTSDAIWAPLHAWRTLGQLQAAEAVPVLIELLYRVEEYNDDWLAEELPEVLGMIGTPAVPELAEYLSDRDNLIFARAAAGQALVHIGNNHPEAHETCVNLLEQEMGRYRNNDSTLNAFLVANLVDLDALKSLPVIEEAYGYDCVDLTVIGDYEDVQIEFGLKTKRSQSNLRTGWLKKPRTHWILPTKPFIRTEKKVGRNDPCPCGSGKKYKKCCMEK